LGQDLIGEGGWACAEIIYPVRHGDTPFKNNIFTTNLRGTDIYPKFPILGKKNDKKEDELKNF